MIHAFRLGPISHTGAPVFAYIGVADGGAPRIHSAAGDREGIAAIKAEALGQPIACEPALADAAKALGLETAPLPPELLPLRAVLAFELASGVAHGASKPDAIAAFLKAAGAFWGARTWELVGPEDRLHVTLEEGRIEVQGEVSVLGGDGTRFPGLALCDEAPLLKKLAPLSGGERAEALLKDANLIMDMEREPAWVAEILGEVYALPSVPTVQRTRRGRVASMVTQDLVVAAALLEGLAAHSNVEEGGHAEVTVQAAGLTVKARVGSTPFTPAAADLSGLTPAQEAAANAEAEAEATVEPGPAAPPEAAPTEAAGPEATVSDATVSDATVSDATVSDATASDATVSDATVPEAAAPEPAAVSEPPAAEAVVPEQPEAALTPAREKALTPAREPELTPAREPKVALAREPELTPVKPSAPEAAPPPAPAPPAAAEAPREGWLSRAWRALRSHGEREAAGKAEGGEKPGAGEDAAAPATPAEAAPAKAAPAGTAPPEPASAAAAPPEHPFAPYAKALKVAIPVDPPPVPGEEEPADAALAAQVSERAAAASAELVSFPAVALQIVELVHSPRADALSVAGFISRDPALAADVVSVANSAAFRGVSEVESVRDAVARLGMEEVGRVASAVAARKLLVPRGSGVAEAKRLNALFVRSVAVATAASAAALRQRGARSDHVWLAGLLHDVGLALALRALEHIAAEADPGHLTEVARAERVLDRVHVAVGVEALRRWALPEYLSRLCANHHDPEVPAGPEQVDLHLVRLTSALAWVRDPVHGARAAREILQSAAALGFGVPAVRALASDLREAEQRAGALVR